MERFEIGRFRAALDRMLAADLKSARALALAPAVMELFGAVAGALLFSYAGRQVAKGRITGGDVMVIVGSLGYFFMSLRRMNTINSEVQQAIAAAKRVFAMMDREREIRDLPAPCRSRRSRARSDSSTWISRTTTRRSWTAST